MATLHSISLKSSISPFSVSQSRQGFPCKWSFLCSELDSRNSGRKNFGSRSKKLSLRILIRRRLSVSCNVKESDNQSNGEEPPESLFMKELKRRGMTPASLLEEKTKSGYVGQETTSREEDGGFSRANAVSTNPERNLTNQREQSMALNSEGLECVWSDGHHRLYVSTQGLIPRARLLLTLGGTFFLGFWPLILITFAFFSTLYLYFGPNFVHDAGNTRVTPPEYIDPYQLLEEERISSTAPRLN
ncbi:uncharacterized protein [Coffea arabica]|uniref:Uncharacterized protein isoform X1 n=1 Tax=Coffea arabica TaxID=13443 RepID=A0ABM4WGZ5_COFAR